MPAISPGENLLWLIISLGLDYSFALMVVQGLAACIHVVVSENAKTARSNPINVARPFKAAPSLSLRGTECRGNPGGAAARALVTAFPFPLPSTEIASSLALLAKTVWVF